MVNQRQNILNVRKASSAHTHTRICYHTIMNITKRQIRSVHIHDSTIITYVLNLLLHLIHKPGFKTSKFKQDMTSAAINITDLLKPIWVLPEADTRVQLRHLTLNRADPVRFLLAYAALQTQRLVFPHVHQILRKDTHPQV